jgi:hypothetical protein
MIIGNEFGFENGMNGIVPVELIFYEGLYRMVGPEGLWIKGVSNWRARVSNCRARVSV